MTPNSMITAAKKGVKDTTNNLDWSLFFQIVIDRIFGAKIWKFATSELNYLHSQSVAEKTFNDDPLELALNHIRSIRLTTSYTSVSGVIIPAGGTAHVIDVVSPQEFYAQYPDNVTDGEPQIATIRVANDGTNGMQISLAPPPNTQAAVWILGDFIPSVNIDSNPFPVLPIQFHWIVIEGMKVLAAEELGKPKTAATAEKRFLRGLAALEDWDRRNPAHKPHLHQAQRRGSLIGPQLPGNFDRRGRY